MCPASLGNKTMGIGKIPTPCRKQVNGGQRSYSFVTTHVLLYAILGGCTVPNPDYRKRDASADAQNSATYHYVFNKLWIPASPSQAEQYGLDLDGNGHVDNSLGSALTALSAFGLDVQASVDKAVLGGKFITLATLETPDFSTAADARFRFFFGDQALPAACSGPLDMVTCNSAKPAVCIGCGHHLTGGLFSISASTPQGNGITGKITNGTFTGGPGNITFTISIAAKGMPIPVDLVGARINATGMNETTIGRSSQIADIDGLVIGGAVKQVDVDQKVLPAVQSQISAAVKKYCRALHTPPGCGCTANSVGDNILGSILNPNKDCEVSIDEVRAIASQLFPPDIVIDGNRAVSIGVRATAMQAQFAVSGLSP